MEDLSTKNIEIHDAVPDDMIGIRRVQKLTWLDTYPNETLGITEEDILAYFGPDDSPEAKTRIEKWIKRLEEPNEHFWVAKDADTVIGFCTAKRSDSDGRIHALYILPTYQGIGVGKKLMTEALGWIGDSLSIYIDVASYNDKALGFYKSFGFIESGREIQNPVSPLPSGRTIPEVELVKRAT